jgi:separase
VFDDFKRFFGVLRKLCDVVPSPEVLILFSETVARVLGLLSLCLPKVQLLDVSRNLAETHDGPASEGTFLPTQRLLTSDLHMV